MGRDESIPVVAARGRCGQREPVFPLTLKRGIVKIVGPSPEDLNMTVTLRTQCQQQRQTSGVQQHFTCWWRAFEQHQHCC